MRAIIYVRVSDARQVENTSLEQQEQHCREWCARHDLEVAAVYKDEGASGKDADRPQFQAMFRWLEREKNRSGVTHLLIDKWDRFARNAADAAFYERKLKNWGIFLQSSTQPVTDDALGELLRHFMQGIAQFDNRQRGERTVGAQRLMAESGRWTWPPPLHPPAWGSHIS